MSDRRPRRLWRAPSVQTLQVAAPTGLLLCTPLFDCGPIVGYPCCKPNVNACNGCKP